MHTESCVETDEDLLKRVACGDEKAFRQLYDRTAGRVTFYLRRLVRDENLVEDVLVETYTAVWKSADRFRGKSRVYTWIIGIARNTALKALRKTRHHVPLDDFRGLSGGNGRTAMETLSRGMALKRAMERLSAKHRETLDLVFFHEMTYAEVATLLGVPVNTVKTRMFYAKDAIRNALQQMGIHEEDI